MKLPLLLATAILTGAVVYGADAAKDQANNATAAFSRLKSLVGEWDADTQMGKAHLSYELIAGGTTLVEHFSAEKTATMLTVYHMDGGRLLLTHYCEAGNQPRMQAGPFNPQTGDLEFHFLDATNLTPGAGHMHSAHMRLTDNNHLSSEWQFFEKGVQKFTETAQYTRVK
jgi:hypothetical protein